MHHGSWWIASVYSASVILNVGIFNKMFQIVFGVILYSYLKASGFLTLSSRTIVVHLIIPKENVSTAIARMLDMDLDRFYCWINNFKNFLICAARLLVAQAFIYFNLCHHHTGFAAPFFLFLFLIVDINYYFTFTKAKYHSHLCWKITL